MPVASPSHHYTYIPGRTSSAVSDERKQEKKYKGHWEVSHISTSGKTSAR
jgi:hypothetical protein